MFTLDEWWHVEKMLNCIKMIDILRNTLQFVNLLIELGIPLALTRAVLQDLTCPTVPEPGWKHTGVPSDLLIRFRLWSNFQCLFSQLILRFTVPICLDKEWQGYIHIHVFMIYDMWHSAYIQQVSVFLPQGNCLQRNQLKFRNFVKKLSLPVGHSSFKSMEWKNGVCFFVWVEIMGCRTLQVRICFNNFCNTICWANYDSLFEILDIWWWMFICAVQQTQRNCALLSSHLGIKNLTYHRLADGFRWISILAGFGC